MNENLNRPIILYMHAGSGNHGCEAIADSTVRMIRDIRVAQGCDMANIPAPVIISNDASEDRKYILGELERQGLCRLETERHIDRDFFAHVFYYGWRKITGDKQSFMRYRFRDAYNGYLKEKKRCEVASGNSSNTAVENKPLAISIGGDNYCYPDMVSDLILAHEYFRKKGFDTVLWGCSIEPDSLKDAALLRDLMSYDHIYARESITYNALLSAGISADKLTLRKDPAFELAASEVELPEGFIEGQTVGINLSPMVLERAGNPELVKTSYRNFIQYILDNTDQNIAFVPHVVWGSNDDRKPLREFYEEYKGTGRAVLIEDNPAEVLKGYISKCSFFVGARTHSTIAAYSSGVPTLVIGYSVKSRGIATDLFGTYENYVLPVQEICDPEALIRSYEFIMKK
ncbi:MAG: polysaccharide pyruvyl transferase family protein [Butyrivibrio sp.]|nr:polysaccharide pyruvyl transferase family protein [Butyrivibrio sp.]